MRCLSCKNGNMADSTNTYFVQNDACYVIVENVPCLECDQCGEAHYTTSVLEKIDDILDKIENIASKIFIMDYRTAA